MHADEIEMAERVLRARWHRSEKTRRDWVRYVTAMDALRAEAAL